MLLGPTNAPLLLGRSDPARNLLLFETTVDDDEEEKEGGLGFKVVQIKMEWKDKQKIMKKNI